MENNNAPVFETGEVVVETVYGSCKRCGKAIPFGSDYCDDCLQLISLEKSKSKSKTRLTIGVVAIVIVAVIAIAIFVIKGQGKNVWKVDSNGVYHYYDANGKMAKDQLVNYEGNTYYVDTDGAKVVGTWVKVGNKDYYFDSEDGKMAVDTLITDGDNLCYFDKEGTKVTEDWAQVGDNFYYLDKDGNAVKDKWQSVNGIWYVFDKDGLMLSDTWTIGDDGKKYYLGTSGNMLTNIVYEINGSLYYFDATGNVATNQLVAYNGAVYYAGADGVIEKNKWVFNNMYYAGDDGKILMNTTTPDGVQVDSMGRRKSTSSGGSSSKTTDETTSKTDSSKLDNSQQETKANTSETKSSVDTSKGIWINSYSSLSDSYEFDDAYIDITIKCPVFGADDSTEAANMNEALNNCKDDMLNLAYEKIDAEVSPKNYKISSATIANVESSKVTVIMKGKLERSGQAAKDVRIRFIYDRTDGTGFVRE